MESELFGHVKGAFTGAISDKVGLLQYATNGTIFLDEIGDMPLVMQAKLLRAFQERSIRRVGDNKECPINCRIVSATNKDMGGMLIDGDFRRDLYYRISTIEFTIPPLRSRPNDILLIAEYLGADTKFLEHLKTLRLDNYHFKGNVRELQKMLRKYIVLDKL